MKCYRNVSDNKNEPDYEYDREILAGNIADSLIFTDDDTQMKVVSQIEKIDSMLADCIKSKIILL